MDGQELILAQTTPPARRCRALAHSGQPCGQPVVSDDMPYCAMHIQKTQDAAREARYLASLPAELRGMFQEQLASGDVKDLTAEIAAARTSLGILFQQIDQDRTNGTMTITREQRDAMRDALNTIRGLVETQAKVKPDQVITLYEMRLIIGDIVGIIGGALDQLDRKLEGIHQHVPPEKMAELHGVRTKLVKDIQKYAAGEMVSRAMVVAYGAPTPRKPEGST
jgi:hypothetical protein